MSLHGHFCSPLDQIMRVLCSEIAELNECLIINTAFCWRHNTMKNLSHNMHGVNNKGGISYCKPSTTAQVCVTFMNPNLALSFKA